MNPTPEDMVREAVAKLLEHYDSCRIFVTSRGDGGETTEGFTHGGGNIYAQQIHTGAA